MIRAYAFLFPILYLARLTAEVPELPQIIPNGIVEDFVDPYKLEKAEFPDGSVAEAVPAVTQETERLAESLLSLDLPQIVPGGIAEHFIDPFGERNSDHSVAEATQESAESLTEEDPQQAASGGVIEHVAEPDNLENPAVETEIVQEEAKPAEAELVPEVVVQEEAKPAEAELVPEVVVQEEAKPAEAELVPEVVVQEEAKPREAEEVEVGKLPGGLIEHFTDPNYQVKPEFSDRPVATETSTQENSMEEPVETSSYSDPCCEPEKKWYFEFKPGYFLFTDRDMQRFYGNGGFTFRAEAGCKVWGPLIVWFDGGYFQKSGKAIGGDEDLEIKLATITLGLKGIYYFGDYVAVYAGAGPRLFMMMMHNDSPFVRGDDNEIGIGAGFDAGFWFFPIPQWRNFFLDLFADYSWKKMKVEADEISSFDFDVDVSGLSVGLGLGIKF